MVSKDDSDLLLHFAEISVAFAGFSSLASVFREYVREIDIKVVAGRLKNMLTCSLSTAVLAIMPLVVRKFDDSDDP